MPTTKNPTMAEQIAHAVTAFQQQTTGHAPKSVSVVLGGDTVVVTLHGGLTSAEQDLAKSPAGAAKVQDFHKQLFNSAADSLRNEIKRITGMNVQEATANIDPSSGAVIQVFTSGTVVQVFLLSGKVNTESFDAKATLPDAKRDVTR